MEDTSLEVQKARKTQAIRKEPDLWRSLDELAPSQASASPGASEIPRADDGLQLDRRHFLHWMAASMALGGAGCSPQPPETIRPYVHAPPALTPAQALFFATSASVADCPMGLLVESNMGRPTKIEGNPLHPASLGATNIFAQASVLDLWDPDRSQTLLSGRQVATWESFLAVLGDRMQHFAATQGEGLRILTGSVDSPTLADQIGALLARFPAARWHRHQPIDRDNHYEGSRLAFGEPLETRLYFDRCSVVLSLENDFLGGPGVRHARDFVSRRRVEGAPADLARLYVVEGMPTLTGAFADHREAVPSSQIEAIARRLAASLGLPVAPAAAGDPALSAWIEACARDLQDHRGRSLVVVGDRQPAVVHALAHAINQALGNVGATVDYAEPAPLSPQRPGSLSSLAADMTAGRVDTLIMLGGNPVYDTPVDLRFAESLRKVANAIHLSLYDDETSEQCAWHIPQAHYLESWSDTRAFDGTVALQQPLIAPLYGGKSAHQLLAAMLGRGSPSDYQVLRDYWRKAHPQGDFESFWTGALHRGVIAGTASSAKSVALKADALAAPAGSPGGQTGAELELLFAPDPTIWDGRFANNAWLQELPKPLTKLTWDNAALVSPALAASLGLRNEDLVELRYRGAQVTAPVWIMPGHADGAVTVTLGYGRSRAGRTGNGAGFNAYLLRQSDAPWFDRGLEIEKTGRVYRLAVTQHHQSMEGRNPVRVGRLEQYRRDPADILKDEHPPRTSLYEPAARGEHAWGMSINLDACIGCSACTIACQAENNIPVVGKAEVVRGREMHWIRVDRYYQGEPDHPHTYFQPVPCMQCERAPCEVVCPVEATVHDSEGLNLQVYNRCVGTRFCSNNCPYKVRRFNFLQYADLRTESLKAQRNPDVTVRMRGVMEKCTYCVQRITNARIEAERTDRRLHDGEVVTACQAVCPTQAIVFSDLNDPDSRVNEAKRSALNYALLGELNTGPRTTYLAKLTNPNPRLEGSDGAES